jgi:insulysin
VDERKYELIRLKSNDLEVLLVSDPTVDRAAISLDVGVGHMSDPVRMSSCSPELV